MKNLSRHLSDPRKTPQSEPIPGRESQMEKNVAGGFTFKTGDWERFDRFLIIGTEGGTYYADERKLTRESADVVRRCLAVDPARVLARTIEVSDQGLAPKNDPAILALALAFCVPMGLPDLRVRALQKVCRTGTHLFEFMQAVRSMRGRGRALNGALRKWIDQRPIGDLALQIVKYRSRAGWTWRDLFRQVRPKPPAYQQISEKALRSDEILGYSKDFDEEIVQRRALYTWVASKDPKDVPELPRVVRAFLRAQSAELKMLPALIRETRVPWECVPSEHTTNPAVLEALFETMPMTATVRQLSKLTAHGVLPKRRDDAIARLTSPEQIARARVHPVTFLVASGAYELGFSKNLTWTPDPRIVDALDDAFHIALQTAEPTGKRILLAIDTSGSMRKGTGCNGIPLFKLAAAMAMTYVRTDNADAMAFDIDPALIQRGVNSRADVDGKSSVSAGSSPLPLSTRMRVVDAMRAIDTLRRGGGTDCSLPFKYALERELKVDAFVVFTDNETWGGNDHPTQAISKYRAKMNPKAKVVWCAMTAGASSCGDPNDTRMLSLSGFDASAPSIVSNFVADRF